MAGGAFSPAAVPMASTNQTILVESASPNLSSKARARAALPPPPPPPPLQMSKTENDTMPASAPLSEARRLLESKLQPAVLTALDCSRKANAGASCAHVNSGRIAIEVWLTADSPAVRAQLQAIGFDLKRDNPAKTMLVGNLALDKLEELARLPSVQFVSLVRR